MPAKTVPDLLVGDTASEEAPEVEGYQLTSDAAAEITLGTDESANKITFTYAQETTYKVRYVSDTGEELSVDDGLQGLVGQEVKAEAKDIADYELTSDQMQTLKLGKDADKNVITFTYKAVPKPEPEPEPETNYNNNYNYNYQYTEPSTPSTPDPEPTPNVDPDGPNVDITTD